MSKRRLIVIGGGAAGLMAAGQAASCGAKTVILEKKNRPGLKLQITGKGRCNLTNIAPVADFITHFGRNGRFLRQAFTAFFTPELTAFFERQGVPLTTERGGRVFPASEDAQDIVDALVHWAKGQGATFHYQAPVEKLLIDAGRVTGVRIAPVRKSHTAAREHPAEAVIIATGGASYPATGSTGDGYKLAESAGHSIVPIRPALVPLMTAGQTAHRLQGLSLRNVTAKLLIDGRKQAEEFGEMLFTHYGLSGPIILTLSRRAVDALRLRQKVIISIDLKPALDDRKLDARLLRDFDSQGKKRFKSILKGLLPRSLIPVCINQTGISAEDFGHQITAIQRRRLRLWLKDFRFEITGHRTFTEAIVTAGGIDTREVDPRTMASRLVEGLYFAGEVLDIDGDTGGYNLQAAFSTGWLAGKSAAS